MNFKNMSSISEALDLNYKAIITLYTYTDELKTITTDISGNLNNIVADVEINKMNIQRLLKLNENMVHMIGAVVDGNKDSITNFGNFLDTNLKMANITKDNTEITDKHERQIKIIVEEFDKMIVSRRREKICYMCDFLLIVCAITALYFFK